MHARCVPVANRSTTNGKELGRSQGKAPILHSHSSASDSLAHTAASLPCSLTCRQDGCTAAGSLLTSTRLPADRFCSVPHEIIDLKHSMFLCSCQKAKDARKKTVQEQPLRMCEHVREDNRATIQNYEERSRFVGHTHLPVLSASCA